MPGRGGARTVATPCHHDQLRSSSRAARLRAARCCSSRAQAATPATSPAPLSGSPTSSPPWPTTAAAARAARRLRDGEVMSIAAQADDAAALIEELGLAPAIVFGTSGGGDIALELVARRPELVRGAIVHEPALLALAGEAEAGRRRAAADRRAGRGRSAPRDGGLRPQEHVRRHLRGTRPSASRAHPRQRRAFLLPGAGGVRRLRPGRGADPGHPRAAAPAGRPGRRAAADPGDGAVRRAARADGGADLGPPRPLPPAAGGLRRGAAADPEAALRMPTHVNGVRLYCEEHGSGAPILCIHGAGGTALAWADAIDKLARARPRDRLRPARVRAQRAPAALRAHQRRASTPTTRPRCSMPSRRSRRSSSAAATAARWRPTSRSATPTGCGRWSCSSPTRRASSRPRPPPGSMRSPSGCARWRRGRRRRGRRGADHARWRGATPGARSRTSPAAQSPATARRSSRSSRASGGSRPTPPRSPRSSSRRCWWWRPTRRPSSTRPPKRWRAGAPRRPHRAGRRRSPHRPGGAGGARVHRGSAPMGGSPTPASAGESHRAARWSRLADRP